MNISDILTENEYTKERSAEELTEYVNHKEKELWDWSQKHSATESLRKIKHKELGKRLPEKFAHELTPFAYYAKTYYGNKPEVRFKPYCGSEQYDGIIITGGKKISVEFTDAIDGKIWGLQKELLVKNGHSPWEHQVLGVKNKKTKRNRSLSDIIISGDPPPHLIIVDKIKETVITAIFEKCKKSLKPNLPYGQNSTILIVTFDDTVINDWDGFVAFKKTKLDSMKHNFSKIILFGWVSKKFID
ncbi:MAG: hypothetical protein JW947_03920 [Sedimentisphaerales bacterium]|nr:hypothetical protein [Sedimentisphaerales bacterium]